ncbi:MAG: aminopeptidase N [Cyclobacteriaceae bacterium]|jgi:aminopeptidase N
MLRYRLLFLYKPLRLIIPINTMKNQFAFLLLLICNLTCFSQNYSRQDSIEGSITKERIWWDLTYYNLNIKIDLENQTLEGVNIIKYNVLEPYQTIQIDLQPPMQMSKVLQAGQSLEYRREGNAYFIKLDKEQLQNETNELKIEFSGKPKIAPRPPWDPGIVWAKDSLGNHFSASIGWGANSSNWWPCKDHTYDEVDSLKFSINVPKDYTAVGNGKLTKILRPDKKTKTFVWLISNPINTYGINFNIGKYAHFSEQYKGEMGLLDCDYYVLAYDLEKAKEQFKQVPKMLDAFEYWFGPYPFYEDGYKLIDVPYSGMEHQGAITYGNGYQNGYRGSDASNTGWGDAFDYIIIHESGHEWFANNISFKDIADIWIHESFTTYSQGLFVEYHYGKQAGDDYQIGIRKGISNDKSMIGQYGINDTNYTGDNYPKGATILHMLRQLVNDDQKWRETLRGLNKEFYHQTVTTQQIESYISGKTGLDLTNFWDQYLRTNQMPVLEYYFANNQLSYRWTNSLKEFGMPLKIALNGLEEWIYPTTKWQSKNIETEELTLKVDRNFYVPSFYSNSN